MTKAIRRHCHIAHMRRFVSTLSNTDSLTFPDPHLSSLSLRKVFFLYPSMLLVVRCASRATIVYCAGITKRQNAHSAPHWFYYTPFINWLYLISRKPHLSLTASTLITKQEKVAIHIHIDDCTSCFLDHTSINCMFPSKKHSRGLLFKGHGLAQHPWGPFIPVSVQGKSRAYLQPAQELGSGASV